VKDFKFGSDKMDLYFAVNGVHSAVSAASLGNVAGIGAFQAAILTVTAGPDAGKYLIVNNDVDADFNLLGNFIVEITGATSLAFISTADFI
jgi:hypothetical protein